MRKENETIIKALNMYGRVPEQYELLNEIEQLQNLIDKTKNYYLKTLAKNGSMSNEAVEMFNLLEGNK